MNEANNFFFFERWESFLQRLPLLNHLNQLLLKTKEIRPNIWPGLSLRRTLKDLSKAFNISSATAQVAPDLLKALVILSDIQLYKVFCCCFFLIGIHSMQGCTATTRHGVTRKATTILGKHSIGREFQSLAMQGKELLR